jgi:hypothetical protein
VYDTEDEEVKYEPHYLTRAMCFAVFARLETTIPGFAHQLDTPPDFLGSLKSFCAALSERGKHGRRARLVDDLLIRQAGLDGQSHYSLA